MNLAFVDNLPVGGGLSRFSLLLCKGLIENDKDLRIDYYIHHDNLKMIPEVNILSDRVHVYTLMTTIPVGIFIRLFTRVRKWLNPNFGVDKGISEIERRITQKYDLAYFPSAHMMKRPSLKIPIVGTLHDFNWKYFFGRAIFSPSFVAVMDVEILKWMKGHNACSSFDVVDEAKKFYPEALKYPTVVHIAPLVVNVEISDERAIELLANLNIDYPYIIFPGNFFPHKNHLNLFAAFSILRKNPKFRDYKLLLTGMGSDQVPYGIACYKGIELLNRPDENYDVRGMGYQPNEVIDALIKNARLLISPSIYEAICTPAMDAWSFGTPTAISDIAPFREHERVLGVRSAFFDPMNPKGIAEVLENYLLDSGQMERDGKISRTNISKYTWDDVARGYRAIFEQAIM